jgi:hypothetical protein
MPKFERDFSDLKELFSTAIVVFYTSISPLCGTAHAERGKTGATHHRPRPVRDGMLVEKRRLFFPIGYAELRSGYP